MKSARTLASFFVAVWTLGTLGFAAEPFSITDDFIAYLKQTTNPHEFGLRPDGRFYPYSTARGRRIGYDRLVTDKGLYHRGCSKAEAEAQLRADAEMALGELKRYMAGAHAARPFDSLSRKSQEILLDFAFSEGPTNLSPAFYEAVMSEDWNRLFDSFMYIRWVEKGWPNTAKNKAFADRWLDPQSRLRPGSAGCDGKRTSHSSLKSGTAACELEPASRERVGHVLVGLLNHEQR